jgi:hypothetical protein
MAHPPPTLIGPGPHNDPMVWQIQFRRAMSHRAFAAAEGVHEGEATAVIDRWYKEAWAREGWDWVVSREAACRLEEQEFQRAVKARVNAARKAPTKPSIYMFCKPMSRGLNTGR